MGKTKEIKEVFRSKIYTVWDFPGKHDVRNYYDMDVINTIAGIRKIIVVYVATIGEVIEMIHILIALKSELYLVKNKCDAYYEDIDYEVIDSEDEFIEVEGIADEQKISPLDIDIIADQKLLKENGIKHIPIYKLSTKNIRKNQQVRAKIIKDKENEIFNNQYGEMKNEFDWEKLRLRLINEN